jgi:hypothetical protein
MIAGEDGWFGGGGRHEDSVERGGDVVTGRAVGQGWRRNGDGPITSSGSWVGQGWECDRDSPTTTAGLVWR